MPMLNLKRIYQDPMVRLNFQQLFSDKQFNDSLDMHIMLMKGVLEKHPVKEYAPRLILAMPAPNGEVEYSILPVNMYDVGRERHEHMGLMGRLAFEKKVQMAACFIQAEGWALAGTAEETKKYMDDREKGLAPKRISDMPNRREVMMVAGCTLDGRSNGAGYDIDRDAAGNMKIGKENYKSYFQDVREEGASSAGIQVYLAESFVTGWVTGLLLKGGMIKEDPMADILKGVDLKDVKVMKIGPDGPEEDLGNDEPDNEEGEEWKKGTSKKD